MKAPLGPALHYRSALRAWLAAIVAPVRADVLKHWPTNTRAHGPGGHWDASDFLTRITKRMRVAVEATPVPVYAIDKAAGKVTKTAIREARHAGIPTRAVLAPLIDRWRDENIALIKSIPSELWEQMRETLDTAEREGWHVSKLSGEIADCFGVAESRADLIARDQVLKLNGKVTEHIQKAAGITEYTWSTSGDERVRPVHRALNNTRHSWDDPPVIDEDGNTGHPGEDYQCRCIAVPVVEEFEG